MSSAQTHSAYWRRRDDGSLLNQFTLSAHSWSRWLNEQAVADYAKCATSVKIRWTKPERSGERLAVAPSRHDRCHGCAQRRGPCDRRVQRIKGQAHHRRLPGRGSEEDIDEIVCRFISKGGKSEIVDAASPDRRVRLSG